MVEGVATTRVRLSRAAVLRDNADSTWREQRRLSAGPRAPPAGMAELVDALDSKSSSGNRVRVRFPLPAPQLSRGGPLVRAAVAIIWSGAPREGLKRGQPSIRHVGASVALPTPLRDNSGLDGIVVTRAAFIVARSAMPVAI